MSYSVSAASSTALPESARAVEGFTTQTPTPLNRHPAKILTIF
jgi:hypothetical protein